MIKLLGQSLIFVLVISGCSLFSTKTQTSNIDDKLQTALKSSETATIYAILQRDFKNANDSASILLSQYNHTAAGQSDSALTAGWVAIGLSGIGAIYSAVNATAYLAESLFFTGASTTVVAYQTAAKGKGQFEAVLGQNISQFVQQQQALIVNEMATLPTLSGDKLSAEVSKIEFYIDVLAHADQRVAISPSSIGVTTQQQQLQQLQQLQQQQLTH
jgi:hypothetical protein